MLTAPTTVSIKGHSASVYTLPPSHLPIDKYIAVNPDECIDIHRAICRQSKAIWYADGAARAGEGWASALQWIIDEGQSGRKMRGSTDTSDALQVELLAICKAVEGFQEVLHHSIKDGNPVSHELVIFCNSAAAIVAIDTSSRSESQHFDQLWRKICSEYLRARLTLVWLPKGADVEGLKLADKIATVAASGSYLRRKKDGTLADIYRRPGGGDPVPSASTIPGAWQRGDADPNFRKVPFERPLPPPLPTPEVKAENAEPVEPMAQDQNPPPPKEAVFVTR
jgi:ribonuclease HI